MTVLVGGLPAARVSDMCLCVGPPDVIVLGEFTVLIGGLPAARMLDMTAHGGMILLGCFTVLIGATGGGGSAAAASPVPGAPITVSVGGLTITGAPLDVARFEQMLQEDAASTVAGRARLAQIIGDKAHPITCLVGRNQPGVLGDSFNSNEVDLDDFEQFASSPSHGHPNEATRGEEMIHFLAERHDAAANGSSFADAHQEGMNAQNEVRAERGQSPVVSQTGTANPDGSIDARFNYQDGTHEDLHVDNTEKITRIVPP
jgi:PAAR motif